MKKLGKLTISPEKMMKNEELINLQGGYSTIECRCYEIDGGEIFWWVGPGLCADVEYCGECEVKLSNYYGRSIYCIEA